MELIPIIELTLGIFTGMLLLALIISYISYKLKKEDKSRNAALMPQPRIYSRNPNYVEVVPEIHFSAADYSPADYKPARPIKAAREEESYSPRPVKKFTVLNEAPPVKMGYVPETTKSFSHKFAPSKAKDAFAMFK